MAEVDLIDVTAAACDVEVQNLLALWEWNEEASADGAVGAPVAAACLRNRDNVGEVFVFVAINE